VCPPHQMAIPYASNLASVDALSRTVDHTRLLEDNLTKLQESVPLPERPDIINAVYEHDFEKYEQMLARFKEPQQTMVLELRKLLHFTVLWQVTVSKDHGFKLSGVRKLLEAELIPPSGIIELVWVTLESNVIDFKAQHIKKEDDENRVAALPGWFNALDIRQYVYGVPMDPGGTANPDLLAAVKVDDDDDNITMGL